MTVMRREFAIVAPDLRLALSIPAIGLVAGLVGIVIAAREDARVWLVAIPIALAIGLMTWSLRRRRVEFDGDTLRIVGGLNSTVVRVADLDLATARIVDLADASTLRPMLKTFGTSMPGFRAGHFRLRDRSRAFLLLTSTRKVLTLRERSGRALLLSLERPQALLDALNDAAHPRR
jgi:hypothetical protein